MSKHYPTVDDKRRVMRENLDRIIDAMGDGVTVQLIPNNMAAGPCPACLRAATAPVSALNAPLMPFDECPHPDQCAGNYRIRSWALEADLSDDCAPSRLQLVWRWIIGKGGHL